MKKKYNSQTQSKRLKSSKDLLDAGLIHSEQLKTVQQTEEQFTIAITSHVQETIRHVGDAVYQQYVPSSNELLAHDNDHVDPIGDTKYSPIKGIVHRYPDRCLLLAANICPVYCRFCFRREKVGDGHAVLTPFELDAAIDYIAHQSNIWEVILSGGDPFMMKPKSLTAIMQRLQKIPHVKIIRFHTRVPVVDPTRVNKALIQALKASEKTTYVVLHANHPQEFSVAAEQACACLVDAGIPLLSQSVLLRGINDDEKILAELMRKFVSLRIKPYYLHQVDLTKGTHHFRVSINKGQQLMQALRGRYSGLCQPTYMLDIPGGFGKVPIGPQYIKTTNNETYDVIDYQGCSHVYPRNS